MTKTRRSQFQGFGSINSLRVLTFVALILAAPAAALAARHERVIDTWQPLNFTVVITLNEGLTEITKARTEIAIKVLKEGLTMLDLDFGEMSIDSVTIGDKAAVFDKAPGLLNVRLPKAEEKGTIFVLAVAYHGRPQDGLILSPDKDGKPSATGDNWPNRVHHWIPCLDHPSAKASVTFTVTVSARELVVANGQLKGVSEDSQNTRTWTYTERIPIPAYCMVIAVGEYAKFEPTTPMVTPLSYYVPQSDARFAMQGFAPAAPSLKFFSETVAPYPYEKLALIVGATRFGGMENSSAIVFASTLLNPRAGPPRMSRAFNINEGLEQVIAHEIAHQWFGDSVTESTWADLWLSEGFATYFAGLFVQKYDGEDAFRDYMKRAADNYLTYEKQTRTPIHDTETEDLMKLLNANNYQKGAWVLHMLRTQLGDESFFRGLRIYYMAHHESTANSDDLRQALEKASGKNLKEFFTRWVYGTGHPRYELSWAWQSKTKTVRLVLKQLQAEASFSDALPVDLISGKVTRRVIVQPKGKQSVQEYQLKQAPSSIQVDPDNTILKEVVVKPAG